MTFNSVQYAVFLAVLWAVYWHLPARHRPPLLLLASYVFYATFGIFLPLLLLSLTVVTYVASKLMEHHEGTLRRNWFLVGLAGTLGVLIAFKLKAAVGGIEGRATEFAVTGLGQALAVPVGLSFITFQAVSHLVDIARGEARSRSPLDTALYLAFFPHLLAGPILRSRRLVPAFHAVGDRPRKRQTREGLELLLTGLFRKVVLADPFLRFFVYRLVDQDRIGSLNLFLLICSVIVAGYFDVSGYIDLARGSAKLLGIDMQPNFAQPLTRSRNWTEFWRRWQITTMAWFRNYVFRPLRGPGRSEVRSRLALAGTFLVVGFWHGLTANFFLWAALTAGVLVAEQAWQHRQREARRARRRRDRARRQAPAGATATATARVVEPRVAPSRWKAVKGPLYVFGVLLVTMPWLLSPDIGNIAHTYRLIFRLHYKGAEADIVVYLVLLVVSLLLLDRRERTRDAAMGRQPLTVARSLGFAAMVTLLVIYTGAPSNQFVYFRF